MKEQSENKQKIHSLQSQLAIEIKLRDGLQEMYDFTLKENNRLHALLEKLKNITPVEWVKVTERLPESNGLVIGYDKDSLTPVKFLHFEDGRFYHEAGLSLDYTPLISMWTPLPSIKLDDWLLTSQRDQLREDVEKLVAGIKNVMPYLNEHGHDSPEANSYYEELRLLVHQVQLKNHLIKSHERTL